MTFTHYIDNFNTAWASGAKGNKLNLKGLPARHEIRELVVEFLTTIKQGAAGPATTFKVTPNDGTASGGTDDLLTIANGFCSRLYLRRDKQVNAINANVLELEVCYGGQHLAQMLGEQVLNGDAIPVNGGAAMNLRIKCKIGFQHLAFETPNMLCPGTEQASLDNGWEISYDAGTIASLVAFPIAGGNVTLTAPTVSLHADLAPVPWPIVAPVIYIKEDQFSNNKDEVFGPILELLFYDNRQPLTVEAQVAYAMMKSDDKDQLIQQTPSQLAQNYVRNQRVMDGLRPFDLSRSVTPIRYCASKTTLEEREFPFTSSTGKRVYQQQLVAGGNPAVTCVRHYVLPIEQNDDSIRRVMAIYKWDGDWRQFPVRFPGRDPELEMFKAREIRPPGK